MVILRDDLYANVLVRPAAHGADELHVLSGYASASFAMFHLLELRKELQRDVTLVLNVGMTGEDGLELAAHRSFLSAIKSLSGRWLRVRYSPRGTSDHSKLFLWKKNGVPVDAWLGSANYSMMGFGLSGNRRESLTPIGPSDAAATVARATAGFVSADADDVLEKVSIYTITDAEQRAEITSPLSETPVPSGLPSITLPLVQTTRNPGEVHNAGAGLNWGQRGSRRRAESYIPVPAAVARSGFFPPRSVPFATHLPDGETIFMTTAQDGDKALHSVPHNDAIGLWVRRRLGLADDAFVQTTDLERYGRTEVEILRGHDGDYFLRF